MLLLLVRHALTPITGKRLTGWLPGHHLSAEGRRQAEGLAEHLAPASIKAVYSSPLERCLETAEVIALRHGLSVGTLEGIGEVRYGEWQGKTLKSLYRTKGWQALRARPGDFRFPGGETIRETQTRAMGVAEELLQRHRGEMIVVVSHADTIRLLVAGYIGLPLDLYVRMSVAVASVTALSFEEVPRLIAFSSTGSLDPIIDRFKRMTEAAASPDRRGKPRRKLAR